MQPIWPCVCHASFSENVGKDIRLHTLLWPFAVNADGYEEAVEKASRIMEKLRAGAASQNWTAWCVVVNERGAESIFDDTERYSFANVGRDQGVLHAGG